MSLFRTSKSGASQLQLLKGNPVTPCISEVSKRGAPLEHHVQGKHNLVVSKKSRPCFCAVRMGLGQVLFRVGLGFGGGGGGG